MVTYVDRQSGDIVPATHYVRGVLSTTLSAPLSFFSADDVLPAPAPDGSTTPAALWNGILYMMDELDEGRG